MIKFTAITEDGKNIQCLQKAKNIVYTLPSNTLTLKPNLIPVDLAPGRLVNHSANVNELGKQLLKAAGEGNVEEIKNLLIKGAPFTADWLGTSPLHLAAQNNHLEATEMLLRAGISKDARTKVDRTPLHMAVYEGYLDIVASLVKHGADINCRDLLGMTPLHWAVQRGHIEVIEYLLRSGAMTALTNKFDLTPMMIAQQTGRSDIEVFLNTDFSDCNYQTENLVFQLAGDEDGLEAADNGSVEDGSGEGDGMETDQGEAIVIPIEPNVINGLRDENNQMEADESQNGEDNFVEDQETVESDNDRLMQSVNVDVDNFTDPLNLLQAHGITMLQTDENEETNILNTVMESGHSVVLTDVGKEVLNSVKRSEQQQQEQRKQQFPQQFQMEKKIVTVTPEEFLAMATGTIGKVCGQLKVVTNKPMKRIVMKKKTFRPIMPVVNIVDESRTEISTSPTEHRVTDMETIMNQLIEARKTIEEYKLKLQKKEQEAERYKMQLKLLMEPS